MSTVLNKSDVRGVDSMGASFLSSPFGSGKEINKIPVRVEGSAGALLTVPKAVPFRQTVHWVTGPPYQSDPGLGT
jgi:hypothetical protein